LDKPKIKIKTDYVPKGKQPLGLYFSQSSDSNKKSRKPKFVLIVNMLFPFQRLTST
jgi:hypothetical protein